MITQQELHELTIYDEALGLFFVRRPTCFKKKLFDLLGSVESRHGYIRIKLNNKPYKAHRLAWLYVHGHWPDEIDHINGDRADNRIANLKACTRAENQQNRSNLSKNNRSGYLGVTFSEKERKWIAQIMINKKRKRIGAFVSAEDAHKAYTETKNTLHQYWRSIKGVAQ